jgi:methionine biosynthesis protein MetW
LKLLETKQVLGQGIEIESTRVGEAVAKGISVIQYDIDDGLAEYKEYSFVYVILNKTLQATYNPLLVMKEAVRVGKKVIVSFPNFGHYIIRGQLFFLGTMPKSKDLPYEWYDTPNIHLVTISDFEKFCRDHQFKVIQKFFYDDEKKLLPFIPNILSPYALFILESIK